MTVFNFLNLAACAFNLVASGIAVYRMRRTRTEFEGLRARYEAIIESQRKLIESTLPAVGLCGALAEDPRTPEGLRQLAIAAIPEGVTITTMPLAPSDARQVH